MAAQTQTKSIFQKQGRMRDYTPAADTWSGDVVVIGSGIFLAANDIAAGVLGALHVDGIWTIPKDASTFADGDAVYWNATGNPTVGTAGTGCATSTASGNKLIGQCILSTTATVATGDATVNVLANVSKNTTTVAGTMTADSVTGTSSTLPVAGLAAAQGGSVSVTGGASSTSANAGGALSLVGGAPGATGIGGAITITGSIGGATSGAGGAVTMTGGAGTAGNAAGGASRVAGGAGQGSAAGGALTLVGGAGGATGAGGAIAITSGAGGATSGLSGAISLLVANSVSGAGANITLTAGAGGTGTDAGGNVNLVGGAAVSTGVPGEVQVNANSGLIYVLVPLTATDASRPVFICTRPMRLKTVAFQHTVGSTSGTLQIEKLTGTTAAGSGTTLLSATIDLSATTVANTTTNGTLIATVASLTFATGDRLSIKIAGTMTNLVNGIVSIGLAPT